MAVVAVVARICQSFTETGAVELLHTSVPQSNVALLGVHRIEPANASPSTRSRPIRSERNLVIWTIKNWRYYKSQRWFSEIISSKVMITSEKQQRLCVLCVYANKIAGVQVVSVRDSGG
jgi:hypothetical protein